MIINMKLLIILFILFVFNTCGEKSKYPNIIYILADDLGYGELGAYGQDIIETPNIDALAKNGMLFTQHYSGSSVCAPSRSVLLTGMHTGHTYIRGNDEWKERGNVWDYEAVFNDYNLEGQRPLPDSITTFAELIQEIGYETAFIGKWGLGAPGTEGVPNNQGFNYFFGYNCQRQAHTLFPTHLWENENKILLNNKLIAPHTSLEIGSDPNNPASYLNFSLNEYAPDIMHTKAVDFIESNINNSFFLLYASPLPHVPLQAPSKWVNYYREKLGPEEPYTGKSYFPNQSPRATYAAMISTLDEQVGDIVSVLAEKNILDNTLIIFTSDNGPTYTGGVDAEFFNSAKPFKAEYGWAKGSLHEGGIRVPMIASWENRIKRGSRSDHLSGFQDIFPTLLELCGIQPVKKTDGISFLNILLGFEQKEKHEYLYWEIPEYGGQQALRMDNFKVIRKNIFKENVDIQLFDLTIDIQETKNVAFQYPAIIKQAETIIKKEHRPSELAGFQFPIFGE
ncbi:MAG: N-acetylgalactosamine-6-sulfatase [Candidatus Marinimicrobia bacterium]|nr:N-acetylgalactosamine-6-sulfatase [Candidatus Neomarinimicrobiota bacterium]